MTAEQDSAAPKCPRCDYPVLGVEQRLGQPTLYRHAGGVHEDLTADLQVSAASFVWPVAPLNVYRRLILIDPDFAPEYRAHIRQHYGEVCVTGMRAPVKPSKRGRRG